MDFKKKSLIFFTFLSIIFLMIEINACLFSIDLVNQDPYPAIPGESVKVVFKVTEIKESKCSNIKFKVLENFPFSVEYGTPKERNIQLIPYLKDYSNFWIVPFTLNVDKNADNKKYLLEIESFSNNNFQGVIHNFYLEIKDVKTDFEINVKNYNPITNKITFEILNIGKNDAKAVNIELKNQDVLKLRGTSVNNIGSLDSNDFTNFEFEALVIKEGKINLLVHYTDEVGIRRTIEKEVYFDPNPFLEKIKESNKIQPSTYIIIILIFMFIVFFFYSRYKRKQIKHRILYGKS